MTDVKNKIRTLFKHHRSKSSFEAEIDEKQQKRKTRLSLGDLEKLDLILNEDTFSSSIRQFDEKEKQNQEDFEESPSPITIIWEKEKIYKTQEEKKKSYILDDTLESKLYNEIIDKNIEKLKELLKIETKSLDK
jgi:hypothetical protein